MSAPILPGFARLRERRLQAAKRVALEERVAALEAMFRSTEHATGNALFESCRQEEQLKERVAALEAEVARLSGHHPAPASDLSGLAAWSSR